MPTVLSEVQGRYYQVGAEISRTEQAIDHSREIRARQRQELEQVAQGMQDADLHRVRDRQLATELDGGTGRNGPRSRSRTRAPSRPRPRSSRPPSSAMSGWQEHWEAFNQSVAAAPHPPRVPSARGWRSWTTSLRRLVSQRDRATQEHGTLVRGRCRHARIAESGQRRKRKPAAQSRLPGAAWTNSSRRCRPSAAASANSPRRPRPRDAKLRTSRAVSCRSKRCSVPRSARARARSSTG